MTCTDTLIFLWSHIPTNDGYIFFAFMVAPIVVLALTMLYYHLRYGDQIRQENLYDTGLHDEQKPGRVARWLRSLGWSAGR